MNRARKITIAVVGLLVLAVAVAAYWRFGRALDVPVATAAQGAIAARVVGPGTVQARVPVTLECAHQCHRDAAAASTSAMRCARASCWRRSTTAT